MQQLSFFDLVFFVIAIVYGYRISMRKQGKDRDDPEN